MMYPYLTLPDDTEIVHSDLLENGRVKVYIETPDEKDGFHHAVCFLPDYEWTEVSGYSAEEMIRFQTIVRNNAHLIIAGAAEGGILNATAV